MKEVSDDAQRISELERQVTTLARIVEELFPKADGIPRRVGDLERQVAALVEILGDLVPVTGALNATLVRLAVEIGNADLYQERFREQDADIMRLLGLVEHIRPPADRT